MWDIIDEFIYQFQSFCQYRAKIMNKSEDEMIALKENVYKVLFFHRSIAVKFEFLSEINYGKAGQRGVLLVIANCCRNLPMNPIGLLITYDSGTLQNMAAASFHHCLYGSSPVFAYNIKQIGVNRLSSTTPKLSKNLWFL